MKNKYLLIGLTFWMVGCSTPEPKQAETKSIPVKVQTIQRQGLAIPVHCSGRIGKSSEIKLSFKTGGLIEKILVKEGEMVKAGQILAILNKTELDAAYNQAKLALDKAKREYARVENLYHDSVATLEQFENVQTQVSYYKEQVRMIAYNLKHSEIKAPSKGIILKIPVHEKEMVGPGYPVILFASSNEQWILRSNISDQDLQKIKPGDTALISLINQSEPKMTGIVTEIGQFADPYSGTFEIELSIQNPQQKLAVGMLASADIYPQDLHSVYKIPIDAIIDSRNAQVDVIFLDQDNKPYRKALNVFDLSDHYFFTLDSLKEGSRIITEGAEYVDFSSELEIQND